LKNNIFILSGVVDETMLYQVTGQGVQATGFKHADNTFFNGGRDVPVGGFADPNQERGFSKEDPKLKGGTGTDYSSWMLTAQPISESKAKGRGVMLSK
jgi:hypothetical protein